MKKFYGMASLILACSVSISSCSDSVDSVVEDVVENTRDVTFRTGMNIGVDPWHDGFMLDKVSRARLEECAKVLHFYDFMGGELMQSFPQSIAGDFEVSLLHGTHDLRFLAHNSEGEQPTEGGKVFTPSKVMDTFLCNMALTVDSETSPTQTVSMSRVVGKVTVKVEDPIPAEVKEFRLTIGNHFGSLNLESGAANGEGSICERSWTLSPSLVGKKGQMVTMFTFVPSGGLHTSVKIEALGESGEVLYLRQSEDVEVLVNRCTTAHCKLFSSDGGFTFEIAEDWQQGLDIDM